MHNIKIKEMELKEDFTIVMRLSDGSQLIYDMKPKLDTVRFHDIKNWEWFCRGKLTEEGRLIRWNLNTEVSINELILWDQEICIHQ